MKAVHMGLPESLARAPVPPAPKEVLLRLQEQGFQAYLVGGCVRDLVAGRSPKDYDVATSAKPEQVQAAFKRVIPTGILHGTVTVVVKGVHVEVTTFRVEGAYVDGRRPTSVQFKEEIQEDLSRRDFTINAMAFDPLRSELVDPFGGQKDLAARVVRAVGEPKARFSEDGLRCLRAARFAAVLGFEVEPQTQASIRPCLPVFRKVAKERVREELSKLVVSDHPRHGLDILIETGLCEEIAPELPVEQAKQAALRIGKSVSDLGARLAVLFHAVPVEPFRALLRRLTFPNRVIDEASALVEHLLPTATSGWTDAQIRRWLAALGRELWPKAVSVAEAVHGADFRPFAERVSTVLKSAPPLSARELALNGHQIMQALGVGPSPHVGRATRFLVDQVLDHPDRNTAEGISELLKQFRAKEMEK